MSHAGHAEPRSWAMHAVCTLEHVHSSCVSSARLIVFISILTETPSEVPTEYLSAWAVAGITLAALSTLIVMALIQSAANLYLHRYVQLALIVCHQY